MPTTLSNAAVRLTVPVPVNAFITMYVYIFRGGGGGVSGLPICSMSSSETGCTQSGTLSLPADTPYAIQFTRFGSAEFQGEALFGYQLTG
jgi:hypothetical protein